MTHHRDLADFEVDHVVEQVLALEEEGRDRVDELRGSGRAGEADAALGRALQRGLVRIEGDRARLTDSGRRLAENRIRRHRLAELLFSTVFDVADDRTVNRTACVMEHILGASVTDSVCSFLGHPTQCPHGKPIPPGPCCRTFSNAVEPLVQPLSRLSAGEEARIVYIVPKEPERLVRLSGLGVVPGARLRLRQRRPAAVISVGETTVALDGGIAAEIYVKRIREDQER